MLVSVREEVRNREVVPEHSPLPRHATEDARGAPPHPAPASCVDVRDEDSNTTARMRQVDKFWVVIEVPPTGGGVVATILTDAWR